MRAITRTARALVPAMAILAVGACGASTDTGSANASAAADPAAAADGGGQAAPSFTATKLGGGELSSASFAGTDTVLWFWAPWCTTCRAEADDVVAAAAALDGSVQVVGVAGRGEVAAMDEFVAETATGGLTHVVDDDGSIWSSFGVASQPSFAFISDTGEVEVVSGALGEAKLTERMQALAAASS